MPFVPCWGRTVQINLYLVNPSRLTSALRNVAIMHTPKVISNALVLCDLGIKNNSHTSIEQSGMQGASTVGREDRSGAG